MARNWMLNPKIHCRNHLLGAHAECHIIIGNLKKKRSITGYINSNCIELKSLIFYHKLLAEELIERSYNHKSPLDYLPDISYLPFHEQNCVVERKSSMINLFERCEECKIKYDEILKYNSFFEIFV